MVLEYATANKLAYGSDIVFTFGPLAPASSEWYFGVGIYAIERTLFCVWLGSLATLLWWRTSFALPGWTSTLLWLWLIVVPNEAGTYLILALLVWNLGLETKESRSDAITALALAPASLAVLALVKFTYFLASVACLGVIVVGSLLLKRRRRPILQISAFALTLISVWTSTGQSFVSIVPWIKSSLLVSGAYADAMQLNIVSPMAMALTVCVFAISLSTILAIGIRLWKRSDLAGLSLSIAFLGLLAIVWKHSVIRADGHMALIHSVAPLLCCLAFALFGRTCRSASLRHWPHLVLAGAIATVSLWGRAEIYGLSWVSLGKSISDRAGSHFAAFRGNMPPTERNSESRMIGTADTALPKIKESLGNTPVDVFNFLQCVAIANQFNYQPRPVFQSYQACSVPLMELNRGYWEQSSDLQLVCRMESIDGRLTSSEDTTCWPIWLTRLAPQEVENDFILLGLKDQSLEPPRWTTVNSESSQLNQTIAVPEIDENSLLRFKVKIARSVLGKVVKSAFQAESLQLRVTMADGTIEEKRIIPAAAELGILAYPYLDTNVDLLAYYADDRILQRRPVTISFHTESGRDREFSKSLNVEWQKAPVFRAWDEIAKSRHRTLLNRSRIPFPGRAPELLGEALPGEVMQLSLKMLAEVNLDSTPSLRLDAPSRIVMRNDKRGGKLEISYLVPASSWDRKKPTDGVRFVISMANSSGEEKLLIDHFVDPVNNAPDRELIRKSLAIEPNSYDWIILKTECGDTDRLDRAIWSNCNWAPHTN